MSDRAELSVREGCRPVRDLPRGVFTVTRLADGEIRLDHADPRIFISGELLEMIKGDSETPIDRWRNAMIVDPSPAADPAEPFTGSLLKVRAVNRNVIYLITEYVPEANGYIGEWPE